MKTTTTFLVALSLFLIQAGRCEAAVNGTILKLDSIVSDFTLYTYQYNPQGQLIREEFFVAGDSVHMIYELKYRMIHTYENGKKVSSVRWNDKSGTVQESERTVYEYEGGKLSVELHDYYAEYNNQWNTAKKSAYQYGTDGLLAKIEYSVLYGTLFQVKEQAVYQYDEQSHELLSIINQIPAPENQWADKTKTAFEYREGNLISQTQYYWNDTTLTWSPKERQEFIYDTSTPDQVTYREFEYQGTDFVVNSEKQIELDNSCPAENLILPYDNRLPYKVENEKDPVAQKVSNYYYSTLEPTGIESPKAKEDIAAYQDPSGNRLIVRSDQPIHALAIYDVSGRLSATFAISADEYEISTLSPGVYFVKINRSGRNTVLKFIKR